MNREKLLGIKKQLHEKIYNEYFYEKDFIFEDKDLEDILIVWACPSGCFPKGSLIKLISSNLDEDYSFSEYYEIRVGLCKNEQKQEYLTIEEDAIKDWEISSSNLGYLLSYALEDFCKNSFIVRIGLDEFFNEGNIWDISLVSDKEIFYEKFILYMDEDKKTFVEGYIVDLSFLKK